MAATARSRGPGVLGVTVVVGVLVAAVLAGLLLGPTSIAPAATLSEVADRLFGLHLHTGLSPVEEAVVWQIRAPRVVLGLMVGGMLALAGGSYQGVFRNPLADPYLLGVAAGAGLGATIAITAGAEGANGPLPTVPVAAFAGALIAVALTYLIGASGGERSPATLLLAGVAVASMLTAVQTYLQLRQTQTLRDVYTWILGDLSTAGWHDVGLLAPYAVGSAAVLLAARRRLDVLAVGDDEAAALGIDVRRTRLAVLIAASLGTAAAVSVSGLIGFVGIIVPHAVRMLGGTSYRVVLPLSILSGAAFLVLADLVARLVLAPAELPIGVVTAALGGPFFVLVLRRRSGGSW
ncbi:MAG: transport system permease protein [Acidimicrobiaceae bacterium]|nr:transport system permease protein [Acidimicrobiaceae bacterium]